MLPGQTAEMIKTAAQKPEERKRYIDKCLNQYAELNNDPVVDAWRMKVEGKMTQARTSCATADMDWSACIVDDRTSLCAEVVDVS